MKLASTTPMRLQPKPGKSQRVVSDDATRNLHLVVGRTAKTWQLRYRMNGKRNQMNLGRYPATTLADARKAANAAMALVDQGVDPKGHAETVAEAWAKYWPERAGMLKNPQHDLRKWQTHIAPVIGSVPLGKLSKAYFTQLQGAWHGASLGSGQNSLLRICRHFQNWCLDRDLLDRPFIPRKPIVPKGRSWAVPTLAECHALLAWCEAQWQEASARAVSRGSTARAVRQRATVLALLVLTGARSRMIMDLRWSDIGEGVLSWPADAMKNGKSFRQPISPAAQAWLDRIPPSNMTYCFPAVKNGLVADRPTSLDLSKWRIAAGFPHPVHALRKGMATWLAEQGYSDEVIGLALSHAPRSVTSVYQKSDRIDERRAALEAWGDALAMEA